MTVVSLIRLFLALASVFFTGYNPVYFMLLYKNKGKNEFGSFSGRFFIFFISFYAGLFITSNFLILLSLAKIKFNLLNTVLFSTIFFTISLAIFIRNKLTHRKIINIKEKSSLVKGRDKLFWDKEALNSCKQSFCSDREIEPVSYCTSGSILGKKQKRIFINLAFGFMVFFITACFLIVIFFAVLFPIRFWDAISCWSLKAKAFFIDGNVIQFYSGHNYDFSHLSYPLYLPLAQAWIYIWLGKVDENLVKIIFPIFYLSLIFIFYHLFKKRMSRLPAVSLVFIIAALPVIMDHGYIEYTNLLFSTVLFLGVYFLYEYISAVNESDKTPCINYLFTAAFMFAILSSIRSEGMLFLLLFLIINLISGLLKFSKRNQDGYGLSNRLIKVVSEIFISVFLSVFLLLPWLILMIKLKMPFAGSEWLNVFSSAGLNGKNIPDLFRTLNSSSAAGSLAGELFYSIYDSTHAFLGSSYGVIWAVLAVLLVFNFRHLFRKSNWVYPTFIVAGFSAVFISIALIGEFAWSADRYILHFLPLTYFWIFYNLPVFGHEKEQVHGIS